MLSSSTHKNKTGYQQHYERAYGLKSIDKIFALNKQFQAMADGFNDMIVLRELFVLITVDGYVVCSNFFQ